MALVFRTEAVIVDVPTTLRSAYETKYCVPTTVVMGILTVVLPAVPVRATKPLAAPFALYAVLLVIVLVPAATQFALDVSNEGFVTKFVKFVAVQLGPACGTVLVEVIIYVRLLSVFEAQNPPKFALA